MTPGFEKDVETKLEALLKVTETNLLSSRAALIALKDLQQEITQIDDRVLAVESHLARQERNAR